MSSSLESFIEHNLEKIFGINDRHWTIPLEAISLVRNDFRNVWLFPIVIDDFYSIRQHTKSILMMQSKEISFMINISQIYFCHWRWPLIIRIVPCSTNLRFSLFVFNLSAFVLSYKFMLVLHNMRLWYVSEVVHYSFIDHFIKALLKGISRNFTYFVLGYTSHSSLGPCSCVLHQNTDQPSLDFNFSCNKDPVRYSYQKASQSHSNLRNIHY